MLGGSSSWVVTFLLTFSSSSCTPQLFAQLSAMGSKKKEDLDVLLAAFQPHSTKKQGYMVKLGGSGIKKGWRQRWFALDDQNLYYFTDESVCSQPCFLACLFPPNINTPPIGQ